MSSTMDQTPDPQGWIEVGEKAVEDCQRDCLLNLIELLWNEPFQVAALTMWLEMTISRCIQDQYLTGKRICKNYLNPLRRVMKELKDAKMSMKSEILFEKFTELLKEKNLYTMYCQTLLPSKVKDILTDVYNKNIKADYLSGSGTQITPTLSTTATGAEDITAVPDLLDFLSNEIREELEEPSTSGCSITSITQNISWNTPDGYCTIQSPGERGFHLVKLELYELKKLWQLPRSQSRREATIRMNFLLASPVDSLYQPTQAIIKQAIKRVRSINDIKKELKKKNYWNSFANSRQAPY